MEFFVVPNLCCMEQRLLHESAGVVFDVCRFRPICNCMSPDWYPTVNHPTELHSPLRAALRCSVHWRADLLRKISARQSKTTRPVPMNPLLCKGLLSLARENQRGSLYLNPVLKEKLFLQDPTTNTRAAAPWPHEVDLEREAA